MTDLDDYQNEMQERGFREREAKKDLVDNHRSPRKRTDSERTYEPPTPPSDKQSGPITKPPGERTWWTPVRFIAVLALALAVLTVVAYI